MSLRISKRRRQDGADPNQITINGTSVSPGASATLTKSDIGLGNVENTALSTWTGSTNLTTLASGLMLTNPVVINPFNGWLFAYKTNTDQVVSRLANTTLLFNGMTRTGSFNTSQIIALPSSGTFKNTSGRTQLWLVQCSFRQYSGSVATTCVLQMWLQNGDGFFYGNTQSNLPAGSAAVVGTAAVIQMANNATLSALVYHTDSGSITSSSDSTQPTCINIYCLTV